MNIPDQADLLATLQAREQQITTLTLERDAALERATAAEARVGELATARDNADSARATAETAAATARDEARQATEARQAALAQLTDFNAKVAAEVRRLGLAKVPAPADPAATPPRKLTATERVLAQKGVRSLAELKAQLEAAA